MIISTQTEYISKVTDDFNAVKMIAEAGFDAIDYSMFAMYDDNNLLNTTEYKAHIAEVKKVADSYGKFFNQAHAMFPSMRDGDDTYNNKVFPRLVRAIEIAGILGVKTVVVHPVQFKNDQFQKNIEMYSRLEPYCAEYKVKVALENMWGWDSVANKIIPNVCSTADDFPRYIDALNPAHFTACLDLGHCGLVGDNAPNMIRALGKNRLTALHVHDNDNIHDSHTLPFMMDMDWNKIADALRKIEYTGDLTLEADRFLAKMPVDFLGEGEKFMYAVAKKLADMITF